MSLLPPWHWSIAGTTGPMDTGPAALLAPQLPAPQLCWLWGCQPCRQRCREGPWLWGSPVAGQGGGQRQDVMRRSYRPCASARQGSSWRICTSRPFHPGHVSGAAHRQGTGDSGSFFYLAPSPQLSFSKKKSTSCLAVSKTLAFCGNAAPLYPWTSWAAGKLPSIFTCGNSRSTACLLHCITTQESPALAFSCPRSAG